MVFNGNEQCEPAWELDEQRPHFSMERFNFYLTRGIVDGSLSPSSDIVDIRDTPSPDGGSGSPAASSTKAVVFPVAKNRQSKNDLSKKTQTDDKKEEYKKLEEMETSEKIPSNTENGTINTTKESTHSRAGIMKNSEEILKDQAKRLGEKETEGENNRKIRTDRLSNITKGNQESGKKQKRVEQPVETRMNGDSLGNKNPLVRQKCGPEEISAEERLDVIMNLKPPSQFQDL